MPRGYCTGAEQNDSDLASTFNRRRLRIVIHRSLINSASRCADRPAIVTTEGDTVSYSKVLELVRILAAQLLNAGIEPQARVGVWLAKDLLSALAPFACSFINAVYVPIHHGLKASQAAHIARDCALSVLITNPERAAGLAEADRELAAHLRLVLNRRDTARGKDFADCQAWDPDATQSPRDLAPTPSKTDDLAALLYTSGSSGKPKGVMVSHYNLAEGTNIVSDYLGITSADRILAALPFSFDYGLNQLLSAIHRGATCILHDFMMASSLWTAVARFEVTGLAGVPTLWSALAKAAGDQDAYENLRYFTNSGGRLSANTLRQLRILFPAALPYLMYGLTEAFRSTYVPPADVEKMGHTIGTAIADQRIFVVKEDGSPAQTGESGELVHTGTLVTRGYWNAPQATAARFRPVPASITGAEDVPGVWSGDRVRLEAGGYMTFLGRADGQLKSSGFRISPEEIEHVVTEISGISEACAVGVDDDELGQRIVLLVTDDSRCDNDAASIRAYCSSRLPTYMTPHEIHFVKSIPRNPNGKHDRAAATDLLGELLGVVDG